MSLPTKVGDAVALLSPFLFALAAPPSKPPLPDPGESNESSSVSVCSWSMFSPGPGRGPVRSAVPPPAEPDSVVIVGLTASG